MPFSSGETNISAQFRSYVFTKSLNELSKKHVAAHFSIEERYFGWNEIFSRNNSGGLQWLTVE